MVRHSGREILSFVGQIDYFLDVLSVTVREAQETIGVFADVVPTGFDLRGIGSLLQDFYTVIEDIFETIAGDFNGSLPEGIHWHKKLLTMMEMPIPRLRPPVISRELRQDLDEYLRFRHIFRNVYGHLLDWRRVRPLLENMPSIHLRLQEELSAFRSFLVRLADQMED